VAKMCAYTHAAEAALESAGLTTSGAAHTPASSRDAEIDAVKVPTTRCQAAIRR